MAATALVRAMVSAVAAAAVVLVAAEVAAVMAAEVAVAASIAAEAPTSLTSGWWEGVPTDRDWRSVSVE
eukprot:5329797-Pleurochrysis_carterae.AAC.1